MIPTETPSIKGTGSSTEQKPATIVYHPPDGRDPQVGAATHHIVTSDREVHVYLGDRREGIDSTLPLDRCEIHRSDKGRKTFGADVDARTSGGSDDKDDGHSSAHADSDGPELVTDGGRRIGPLDRTVVYECDLCTGGVSVPVKDHPMDEVVCRECKRQRNPPTCQLRVGLDKAEEIQEDTNLTEDEAVAYALHDLQNLGLDIIAHLTGVAPRDVPSEDVARGCVALELMAAREKFAGQEASDEHLMTDGGQTPAELLFGSRIHELPFLFACTNDGDTFIDERHYSESDRATLHEYEAPRGPGYDLIVAETGEVLMSGGELTANTQWEALTCEVCSEAFLFISVEAAPESCPECGATEDCGEENGGEE